MSNVGLRQIVFAQVVDCMVCDVAIILPLRVEITEVLCNLTKAAELFATDIRSHELGISKGCKAGVPSCSCAVTPHSVAY